MTIRFISKPTPTARSIRRHFTRRYGYSYPLAMIEMLKLVLGRYGNVNTRRR
jgi:hypothetical protein